MTTTDLIKILSDKEYGAISHKPRNISLTINGKYMPNPRITLSSTGDGIVGPEIDLDIDGEFFEEQESQTFEWCTDCKEYDQEKHCCHRWSKVIRNTVEEMKQQPCEDCISRQAAIDALSHMCSEDENGITVSRANVNSMLRVLPPVTPRSLNPEADREESKAYCAECDHIEMCSWYPHDGCEWLKTDRYNSGYNAAKKEIALSGEYKRAYERGKADAQPKIGRWKKMVSIYDMIEGKYRMIPYTHKDEELSNPPFYVCDCGNNSKKPTHYCPDCGTKMIEPQERSNKE